MKESTAKKLMILAESAKYDVSCSSSGVQRQNTPGGIGSAASMGICHSFTEDGRCVSLLKLLQTNRCSYDCAYCVNRRSNDVPRASLSAEELVEITIEFYRRNYIEGLFLSSAVEGGADVTMERMLDVVRRLRMQHRFNGYIHMKGIPGASQELMTQAGLYADRISINIEIPSDKNLRYLAPGKNHKSVYLPMRHVHQGILENSEEKKRSRNAPRFCPAGQSTQLIVGASDEKDKDILLLSSMLYKGPSLKRVYYSGFVPVNGYDTRLPMVKAAPLQREHRLYQADWLMRFYHFEAEEIANDAFPELDQDIDPKLSWALRHPEFFPVDVNKAEYQEILRVPGIGVKSALKILSARRYRKLNAEHLKKIGVVMKKATFFIATHGTRPAFTIHEAGPRHVRRILTPKPAPVAVQLQLM